MDFSPDDFAAAFPRMDEKQLAWVIHDMYGHKLQHVTKLTWEHEKDISILLSTRIHDIFERRATDVLVENGPYALAEEDRIQLAHNLKRLADALKMNPVKTRIIHAYKSMWRNGVFG